MPDEETRRQKLEELIRRLSLQEGSRQRMYERAGGRPDPDAALNKKHKFWDTQPVPRIGKREKVTDGRTGLSIDLRD